MLAEAIPVERLDRVDDPGMKLAATLLQQSSVRDIVRERVREGILKIRIEPGLIEEVARLQVIESATECLVRELGDRLEQRERQVLAYDGATCSRRLSSGSSRSTRAASITWTVGGTWIA